MTERLYNDEEVAEIFRRATASPDAEAPRSRGGAHGLTLAELKDIAKEVAIPGEAIAAAAVAVDASRTPSRSTFLGVPVGLARVVELGRTIDDAEWVRLVARLRDVFDAHGTTRTDGPFREWSNGNLRVLVEPSETGHRVRLRTANWQLGSALRGGLVALAVTGASATALAIAGTVGRGAPGLSFLAVIGVGLTASSALRLQRWARERSDQFDAIEAELIERGADSTDGLTR